MKGLPGYSEGPRLGPLGDIVDKGGKGMEQSQPPRGHWVWLAVIISGPWESQKSKRETEAGPPRAAPAASRVPCLPVTAPQCLSGYNVMKGSGDEALPNHGEHLPILLLCQQMPCRQRLGQA